MNKKLLALPLVLILAACGKDEPKQALECNHPAAIQSIDRKSTRLNSSHW